jgi:gliding motility-associated-like protein
LAAAIYNIPNNNIEVFDFDNVTGIVSNPVYIPTVGDGYGIAFSPNSTKLYATLFSTTLSALMQYDLTAANIPASAYTVANGSFFGALQLGPNGKVYLSPGLAAFLDVVNNPNVAGVGCNYVANAVSLTPNSCNFGLPNFPDNLIYSNFSLGNDICGTNATLDAGSGWVSYNWSTGATTQTVNVLQTGTYWAQVTNSCGTVFTDTINVVSGSTPLSLGSDITICSGSATLDAGPGGSSYLWSTGATSQTINIVTSGTYFVQKTEACAVLKDTIQVTISPVAIPSVTIGQISCFGGTTTVTVNVAGGAGNFQYSLYGGVYQNSNIFTNVSGGLYSLLIKDGTGCISSTSVLVNEPAEITGHITSNGIACFGGVADIIASIHGGIAPLSYSLNGGAPQTTNNFSVTAGTYSVLVTDANGCIFMTNTLVLNEPPAITASLSATTLPCFGDISTLTVTASGGTGNLEYSLQGINYQNGNTFQLPAGDYAVVIRDANGCIFLTNSLTIATPQAIGATLSATPILCHDETSNLSATAWNGTPPYLYSLNNAPFQSANNFPNLTGGNYTINVQDANGCTSPNYNINIVNPLAISILANADTACFGKTTVLGLNVSGGTGNLAVTLNGNPSPAQANVNLSAGNYTINVQDSNLCTATTNLNIPEYAPINFQIVTLDSAYCNKANGAATILATGGSESFTYTWFTTPPQYGASLQQVTKGTYSVRVQDAKGCRLDSLLKIPHILPPIAQFTSVPTNTTATLSENENIQFTAFTANAYSFSWSFGDGLFSDLQNPIHSFYNEGTYPVTLTAYDVHKECSANFTLIYNIEDFWNHFFIPNVFTPNGDTQFDKWMIESYPYQSITVKVFDRWGMDIFETNDLSKSWNGATANGKACSEGVYFYYVKVQNLKNESREFKGNVTLMR